MQHAPLNRLRRVAVHAALPLLLGVISLTLTQCRMVGDNLTGVGLFRSPPTTCIKKCNDDYKRFFDDEQKLYHQNTDFCKTLPQPQKDECQAAEDARHAQAMADLGAAKIQCQQDCDHQGGGGAQ